MQAKRKGRSGEKAGPPLPVPLSSTCKAKREHYKCLWDYYEGNLMGQNVIVTYSGDADSIHKMGCFGTMLLARTPIVGSHNSNQSQIKATNSTVDSEEKTVEVEDHLCLSLEEAFFLSYGLGCLFISHDDQRLDVSAQWTKFCSLKPNFHATYAVYHHFRTKGWVTREGLKYGTDFLLYDKGPTFNHASYAVRVVPNSPEANNGAIHSWRTIMGLNRLVSSVSKRLVFCYTTVPEDADLSSPKCLENIAIDEVTVNRWSLTKERDDGCLDVDATF